MKNEYRIENYHETDDCIRFQFICGSRLAQKLNEPSEINYSIYGDKYSVQYHWYNPSDGPDEIVVGLRKTRYIWFTTLDKKCQKL